MVMTGFRGPQVCKIVGISYRQLDYWARTDLIRPSIADARGSGTQRLYSYRDLVELKVIKHLLDAGISLRTARTAIEYLRDHLGEELASASLVINLVRQGQGVLNILPLAGMIQELDSQILELAPSAVVVPGHGITTVPVAAAEGG